MAHLLSSIADPERLNVAPAVWVTTIAVIGGILLFDVVMIARRPRVPSTREVSLALGFYVGAAVLFGLGVWWFTRQQHGTTFMTEFFAGWLTEYSLSVDNLFVFVLVLTRFAVPARLQQTALMVGIVIAILLRAIFIALGAAAITRFSWVFYLFGAFLVVTALRLAREAVGADAQDAQDEGSRMTGWLQRWLPTTDRYHGSRLLTRVDGAWLATPLLLVILALGVTDLLFAVDSIPAIYGLTKEPYLVLTANLFALMGLRQLYFLIGGLLSRLVYLSVGLAVLLGFIGVKLVLHALHENRLPFVNGGHPVPVPEIPTGLSLGAIVAILAVTTVASLARSRGGDRSSTSA